MAIRKSNRGASVDMDALISKSSPSDPAIGNMRVNAKGDKLGANGEVIQKNEDRVRDYYKDNPKSSTSTASLKGGMEVTTQESDTAPVTQAPEPAKATRKPKLDPDPEPVAEPVAEPDEFDAPEEMKPLGYKEVHLPNGDIDMVPYYREEDK